MTLIGVPLLTGRVRNGLMLKGRWFAQRAEPAQA